MSANESSANESTDNAGSPARDASKIVHTEVMELDAPLALVREFVLTPDRILDYFPAPVEGGILEAGRAIFCRGEMGTSMLEKIEAQSHDQCVVVKVTTALGLEAPFTRERIEAGSTFTMVEDWELAPTSSGGTRLTKTWRDVEADGPEPFPLADAVKQGAIHESEQLIAGWNAAAKAAGSG